MAFFTLALRLTLIAFVLVLVQSVPLASNAPNDDLETIVQRSIRAVAPSDNSTAIEAAHKTASAMFSNGTWPGINYADKSRARWDPDHHLQNLITIASGVYANNSDTDLVAAFHTSLDVWIKMDPTSDNWWWNQIGAPQHVGTIGLLSMNLLTSDEITGINRILLRADFTKWTGANLVWMADIAIVRGAVTTNATAVQSGFDAIYGEIFVADQQEDNIMRDASFHQHGPELLSGSYGSAFTSSILSTSKLGADTKFAIPSDHRDLFVSFILDGQRWMLINGTWDWSVTGRQTTRPPGISHANFDADALLGLGGNRTDELKQFAASLQGGGSSLRGNRYYWDSDYLAHHKDSFSATLHLFSNRTTAAKCVNEEGKLAKHFADGVTNVYTQGANGADFNNVFPVLDWTRLPGTVGDSTPIPSCAYQDSQTPLSFVGGASDGTSGAAAMDLRSASTTARRTWLFTETGFIAAASNISLDSTGRSAGVNVTTTIDARPLVGDVTVGNSSTSFVLSAGSWALDQDITWVHHNGIGYIILSKESLDGAALTVTCENRTGTWSSLGVFDENVTMPLFELYLNSIGAAPASGESIYAVVPGVDASDMHGIAAFNAGYDIADNSGDVQALVHPSQGVAVLTFWRPGSVSGIGLMALGVSFNVTADQPCIVLLSPTPDGSKLQVTVSNPTTPDLQVAITLTGDVSAVMTFQLPGQWSAPGIDVMGQPVSQTLVVKRTEFENPE